MWRKDLFIDTRFSQIDSTDIKQHQEEPEFEQNPSQEYKKNEAMLNFMMLDFYYRGIAILDAVFDRNDQSCKMHAFQQLKMYEGRRNDVYPGVTTKRQLEFTNLNRRRETQEPVQYRRRQHSESVDRMNILNNIADRILENKRIKSESKNSPKSHISQKEGKKILSKLDKLEKMIKNIRKQNQLSNQASVVYINRNRYAEDYVAEGRYTQRTNQLEFDQRPHTRTPTRNQVPYRINQQPTPMYPYTSPRYYQQPSIQAPRYRYPERAQTYVDYQTIQRQVYPIRYRQDESIVHHGNISQRLRNFPFRQHHNQDQQYNQSEDSTHQNQIKVNQQIENIKQQLNQLKKINIEYISRNQALEEEARKSKEKKYTYQNQLPQRVQPRKVESSYIRQSSMPKSQQILNKHPIVPSLDLRKKNDTEFLRQGRNNNQQQQREQPRFYTHRTHHPCQTGSNEYANYPIPEYETERGSVINRYNTPLNVKHHKKETSNNMCGHCGCRCHDHQMQGERFDPRGYQGF